MELCPFEILGEKLNFRREIFIKLGTNIKQLPHKMQRTLHTGTFYAFIPFVNFSMAIVSASSL